MSRVAAWQLQLQLLTLWWKLSGKFVMKEVNNNNLLTWNILVRVRTKETCCTRVCKRSDVSIWLKRTGRPLSFGCWCRWFCWTSACLSDREPHRGRARNCRSPRFGSGDSWSPCCRGCSCYCHSSGRRCPGPGWDWSSATRVSSSPSGGGWPPPRRRRLSCASRWPCSPSFVGAPGGGWGMPEGGSVSSPSCTG